MEAYPYPPGEYIEPPPPGNQQPLPSEQPGLMAPMIDWLLHIGKLVPVEHDPFAPSKVGP